ncbi:MAG: hypothetical protein IKP64_02585 [Selenomonadaceae bacterium]|nr:hypothetical protein [Selenomonadaceae bacterium]
MTEMANLILIGFGGIVFLLGIYVLFKILTSARKKILDAVDGDFFAYLSLIAWVLTAIIVSVYWIYSSIDFEAARNFRRYMHGFAETYLFEGALCLLLTYGFAKINPEKLNGRAQMSDGKRSFVIIAGIFFGLLAIYLGLKKIVAG